MVGCGKLLRDCGEIWYVGKNKTQEYRAHRAEHPYLVSGVKHCGEVDGYNFWYCEGCMYKNGLLW